MWLGLRLQLSFRRRPMTVVYQFSSCLFIWQNLNRSKLMALYCICSEDFIWESDFLCGSSLPLQLWMYSKWIGTTTSSHFEVSRPEPLPLIIHTILCNGLEGIVRYSTLWSSPPERIKNAAPKLIQNNEFLCVCHLFPFQIKKCSIMTGFVNISRTDRSTLSPNISGWFSHSQWEGTNSRRALPSLLCNLIMQAFKTFPIGDFWCFQLAQETNLCHCSEHWLPHLHFGEVKRSAI